MYLVEAFLSPGRPILSARQVKVKAVITGIIRIILFDEVVNFDALVTRPAGFKLLNQHFTFLPNRPHRLWSNLVCFDH